MEQEQTIQPGNLKIEFSQNEDDVHYCNFAIVSHSPEEFVLDFAQILPGSEGAKVVSRVIMTPKNVKNFLFALGNNVSNYEKQFGEIVLPQNPLTKFSGEVQ